ncbi:hypothetical protein GOP47_0003216 [Adiantum capillus-veneris]|uniref:Uncharacterized protein n=1 Tax=Adiantum capillus-veneris TaxID=13818 RepID=A0A9D4VC14_ADICA|nr:hypothetical protein GOP47_0003216 [Adiantum capillus-veneris]
MAPKKDVAKNSSDVGGVSECQKLDAIASKDWKVLMEVVLEMTMHNGSERPNATTDRSLSSKGLQKLT